MIFGMPADMFWCIIGLVVALFGTSYLYSLTIQPGHTFVDPYTVIEGVIANGDRQALQDFYDSNWNEKVLLTSSYDAWWTLKSYSLLPADHDTKEMIIVKLT